MDEEITTKSNAEQLKSVIAGNIADLRRKHKMTQLDLAEKLNYTDKAISKWERGESIPDVLVLKSIADLFGVTVDYLLEDVHAEPVQENTLDAEEEKRHHSIRARGFVTGMSVLLVWLVATVVFVIFDMVPEGITAHWIIFIYAVPASMILWLVMNSIWFNRRWNYPIISLLMWSILASVYISVWQFAMYNAWIIFMLGIPGQAIIVMWSRLKQGEDISSEKIHSVKK